MKNIRERLQRGRKSLFSRDLHLEHSLFLIEEMTQEEVGKKGEGLVISYSLQKSPFGEVIIASTDIGICSLTFKQRNEAIDRHLRNDFPKAILRNRVADSHKRAMVILKRKNRNLRPIKLHLSGTPFQLRVWNGLLRIPLGEFVSYGDLAEYLKNPKGSRAVGSAVGKNPISCLIPCHRVIQKTGALGGFYWGLEKKEEILNWEFAQSDRKNK